MNKWLLALALALAACGGGSTPAPTIEQTTFASSLGVNLAASTKTADGLYYRDLTTGGGALVQAGQTVTVQYSGAFPTGATFDSGTFPFLLGAGQVIRGFDEGVSGMKVGGSRQLIIPPALGYGSAGNGSIPPNAILVFAVQVQSAQ
jgi:FKBP-type peptidyl-prolyl cis-trans isomerase